MGEFPVETTETTGRKRTYPPNSFILPYLNYICVENLKPPSRNYRNYKVQTHAYNENLNCSECFPVETTETTGQNKYTSLNSLIFLDSDYTLHRPLHTYIKILQALEAYPLI